MEFALGIKPQPGEGGQHAWERNSHIKGPNTPTQKRSSGYKEVPGIIIPQRKS